MIHSVRILFFVPLLCVAGLCAQEPSVERGDQVEFEFMGKVFQAKVLEFDRNDDPVIRFRYGKRLIKRSILESRLKVIGSKEPTGNTDASPSDINDPDNPFGKTIGKPKSKTERGGRSRRQARPLDSKANSRSFGNVRWKVELEPAPRPSFADSLEFRMPSTGGRPFSDEFSELCCSTNGKHIAVSVQSRSGGKVSHVLIANLVTGKSDTIVVEHDDAKVIAVSSSGKKIVTWGKDFPDEVVDFWDLDNPEKPAKTWIFRFHDHRIRPPDIETAVLLNDSRLLTIGDQAVLWDLDKNSAVYSYDMGFSGQGQDAAVSPGGKYLALGYEGSVYLVECLTGELHGRFNPPGGVKSMAFSPDGTRIAGFESRSGWVWDLTSNELLWDQEFESRLLGRDTGTYWTGNDYVLAAGSTLLDATTGDVVWRFKQDLSMRGKRGETGFVGATNGLNWIRSSKKLLPIKLTLQDMLKTGGDGRSDFDQDGLK